MLGAAGAALLLASLAGADPSTTSIIPDKDALEHEHAPNRLFVRFREVENMVTRHAILADVGGEITMTSKIVPGL
ncbi:MAG: hypothetical protein CMJ36_06080, partial [Phycisphaerae bacterium]|nr:hypothetical protein [Phycisphaerae bacterium]